MLLNQNHLCSVLIAFLFRRGMCLEFRNAQRLSNPKRKIARNGKITRWKIEIRRADRSNLLLCSVTLHVTFSIKAISFMLPLSSSLPCVFRRIHFLFLSGPRVLGELSSKLSKLIVSEPHNYNNYQWIANKYLYMKSVVG